MDKGKLFVVGTPIGNRGDMTPRAIKTLSEVDVIACEDTRVTRGLLTMYGIKNTVTAYHKFNEREKAADLVRQMTEGKTVAVVTDAGMPCISDPGAVLVAAAADAGIEVVAVPGAAAVTAAVALSGFAAVSYVFCGFFGKGEKEIAAALGMCARAEQEVYVFYESPKRIEKTVSCIEKHLPDARLAVCNDITKLHERVYRGTPAQVLAALTANPNADKGEYAVVLHRGAFVAAAAGAALSLEAQLVQCMVENDAGVKDAVAILTEKLKGAATKKDIYAAALALKKRF
ncbi:MAG: 16S rRNA (cytidine(1402)-2'-O)-methyltransferase [Clostridiales bacterium]|jgi:16S rRNA (cytidine1402-2'-O)-methyltransferase|nr:16S rRNA (cytidine(1402)-2'-O)-methyltransferase [Clostridiales bacterium]